MAATNWQAADDQLSVNSILEAALTTTAAGLEGCY